MKWILLLIFLTSRALPQSPSAAACRSVDLREETCPSGIRRLPPPTDQGTSNYCFAHALTNIYSYASCVAYSPLSTGLLVNRIFEASGAAATLQKPGGSITSTLNRGFNPMQANDLIRTARLGPCLEADFPSSAILPSKDPNECEGLSPDPNIEELLLSLTDIVQNQVAQLRCPHQTLSNLQLHLDDLDSEVAITRALEQRQVAAVHLNSKLFGTREPLPRGGDHYVTVIGQRMISGTCHYLVRDSNRAQGQPTWETEGDYDHWIPRSNVLSTVDEVIQRSE